MDAHNVTLDVCSHCGEIAGGSAHGHTVTPDWRWEKVDYVPAKYLRTAEAVIETQERNLQSYSRGNAKLHADWLTMEAERDAVRDELLRLDQRHTEAVEALRDLADEAAKAVCEPARFDQHELGLAVARARRAAKNPVAGQKEA